MTVTLPLPMPSAGPSRSTRPFGDEEASYNVNASLVELIQAVRAAKRIVVICGAGVSTAASIPDFRSAQGLFSTRRTGSQTRGERRRARERAKVPIPLVRGKQPVVRDLFHVKALLDDDLLPAHNHLLNSLREICHEATPTSFHTYLSRLDEEGRLLRCYTQNIDGLEEKAGLRTGLPERFECVKRRRIGNPPSTPESRSSPVTEEQAPRTPPRQGINLPATPESQSNTPVNPYPRVIPLHGSITTLNCTFCSHTLPYSQFHPLPAYHLPCPACSRVAAERSAASVRARPEGLLRPNVVLYGEDHPQGHLIGKVVERDLKGLGGKEEKEGKVDFLIVAGTSLSIPGVKRMVKEMSRAVEGRGGPRRVYINDEPPHHAKEWEEVFDVWVKGDIQHFVKHYLNNPTFGYLPPTPKTPRSVNRPLNSGKRKRSVDDQVTTPSRSIKLVLPPTPSATPRPVIPARYWRSDSPLDSASRSPSLTPIPDEPDAFGNSAVIPAL